MAKLVQRETIGEEIFNSIIHGIGALLSAVIFFILIFKFSKGSILKTITFATFGFLMFFVYLASTLCHSLSFTKVKKVFQVIDHSAIYLFIAASYTPFALLVIGGILGWIVFGFVWVITILGIIYKTFFINSHPKVSLILYLGLGWCAVLVAWPLLQGLSILGFLLLVLGGLFYSIGAIFFAWKKLKFNHAYWHIFVLGGSVCHLLSLLTI